MNIFICQDKQICIEHLLGYKLSFPGIDLRSFIVGHSVDYFYFVINNLGMKVLKGPSFHLSDYLLWILPGSETLWLKYAIFKGFGCMLRNCPQERIYQFILPPIMNKCGRLPFQFSLHHVMHLFLLAHDRI